uniref:Uncharacterized protein n=1 Tax=Anopheles albimanus TaxID=7167 RepID=A0A182FZE0_ANOAL
MLREETARRGCSFYHQKGEGVVLERMGTGAGSLIPRMILTRRLLVLRRWQQLATKNAHLMSTSRELL